MGGNHRIWLRMHNGLGLKYGATGQQVLAAGFKGGNLTNPCVHGHSRAVIPHIDIFQQIDQEP